MKFVYPEFLWAFGVLLIPLIIHLFNFRKYKTLYFSSLQFIKVVDQQTRSTQKLKHLLVFIARSLFIICLVIAFAQPFIPVTNNKSKGGKPVLAIYIDNSFSMAMKGTEGELISEAREMARKMISNSNLDTRFMLVTNNMNGIEQRLVTKIEALERLDKIEFSPIIREIGEVIEWEKAAIQNEHETKQKIGTKQFVIFSDFQKSTASFQNLTKDEESYYYPVKVTSQDPSNLTVDSLWFTSPIQKIGQNNELNVRVHNYSSKDIINVEVHLEVDHIKRDVFLDIPANNSTTTVFNYTEQTSGIKEGKVSVNDKQFYIDDEYHFSYSVSKQSSILIINGDNAVNNIATVYSLDNFYTVETIEQTSFTLDALNNKDLVIINGAKEIPSGLSENMIDYVNNGGALALFPGENIDLNSWNNLLLSLKMPTLSSEISEGVKIKNINYDDVFFKEVFEKKPINLNLPAISKSYKVNNTSNSLSMGLLFLQNGNPLYSRTTNGKNVFLYASSLTPNYGSFTTNALFSTILLRTAELSKRKTPISLIIGEDSKFPIYFVSKNEIPIHLKNKEVDFIPRTIKNSGSTSISISGMEAIENLKAGTYSIIDDGKKGAISLNYNRKESNIEVLTENEIHEKLNEKGIKHIKISEISEGQSLTKIDLDKPYEYWRIFLILSLIFILTEIALLKFWKK
ncbi:MAG: BatA domain-containing protein [Flavobacteriia bacterium]|nr:BatA domain-containing protein [Flavobacteriia bacterium]